MFHAGDGNLHPLVLYDAAAGEAERAERLATDILAACIEAGGSLGGEHGIGLDKACNMPRMYSDEDIAAMLRLRTAFDPDGLCDPARRSRRRDCAGEVPGPYRTHPAERDGVD